MVPFHDSVSDAIIGLVENPYMLEKKISPEDKIEDILSEISRIKNMDSEDNISITEKAENEFQRPAEISVTAAIDYFVKVCAKEIDKSGSVSANSALHGPKLTS
jgi:hypothetical protein